LRLQGDGKEIKIMNAKPISGVAIIASEICWFQMHTQNKLKNKYIYDRKKNETITLTNKHINKQIKILVISTLTKNNNRCRKICEYLS